MITISNKCNCCGCGACAQACPKNCISLVLDNEGFLYPLIDTDNCIDCGKCERVCPYLNQYETPQQKPLSFACRSIDEQVRFASSSGGLFSVLADNIVSQGGFVFGARFDDQWSVIHDCVNSKDGIALFRGSKYSQSIIGDSYRRIKSLLSENIKVLFTGTPCQVAGLNHFLGKQYDNLFTVDFVCHSVPSPKVWRKYLQEISGDNYVTLITFRDKELGWSNYGIKIYSGEDILVRENKQENVYLRAFLSNLIVRPSCFNCPARNYKSGSDITIADCWGFNVYHPDLNDEKGMSLALLNTSKGRELYHLVESNLFSMEIPFEEVEEETNHKPLISSARPHYYRTAFFKEIDSGKIIPLMNKYLHKGSRRESVVDMTKKIIRSVLGQDLVSSIRKKYNG